MIKKFRIMLKSEGRSLVWFHRNFIQNVTYQYFIIQLHEPERMHEAVWDAMADYLKGA